MPIRCRITPLFDTSMAIICIFQVTQFDPSQASLVTMKALNPLFGGAHNLLMQQRKHCRLSQ